MAQPRAAQVETQPLLLEVVWYNCRRLVGGLRAVWYRQRRLISVMLFVVLVLVVFGGPGFVRAEGGYPWASALPRGTTGDYWVDENGNNRYDFGEQYDQFGYTYRNCTSWVAWRLNGLGASNLNFLGNATDWTNHARSRGVAVDAKPIIGDAAVWDGTAKSPGGHLAFVEHVNADASVVVSEYNKGLKGEYATGRITRAPHYIHFLTADQRRALGSVPANQPEPPKVVAAPAALVQPLISAPQPAEIIKPAVAPPSKSGTITFVADVNGDHKGDLITIKANADGHAEIYWKPANGLAFAARQLLLSTDLVAANTRWSSGDVNGDGLTDIVAITKRDDGQADVVVFVSQGTTLGPRVTWVSTSADQPYEGTTFLLSDVDGDGKQDLTAVRSIDQDEPTVYWFHSTGDHFEAPGPLTS